MAQTALMSVMLSMGLLGVSIQMSRVLAVQAASMAEVPGVDEGELHAEALEDLGEDPVGAAVEVVAGDDVVAGVQRLDDRRSGGHAGSEAQTVLGAFQGGQVGFKARRVGCTVRA